ncbi:DUF3592 domain-containing protein [Streptomyces sp. NPDC001034]|uniref:DUF3592 domain-containing protein n=1 Tax=Streptomyces sp. NPDC001034 TaxID=3154375 RepID=UPI00332ACB02
MELFTHGEGLSMGKPGGAVDLIGIIFIVLGTMGIFIQMTSFVVYRRLRILERVGVEGEAVVGRHDRMDGLHRIYFQVRLPEGRSGKEFYEKHLELIGEPGAVVPVIYDRRKPGRAKTGSRADIEYRAERFAVYLLGGGGLTLFVAGFVMVALVRPW